jgi:hypothetical protein
MNDKLILLGIYLIFFGFSYIAYRNSHHMKSGLFYLLVLFYLIAIYAYYEMINSINIGLRNRGHSVNFGHASLSLILVMALSYLTAIVFVVLAIQKRRLPRIKISKSRNH